MKRMRIESVVMIMLFLILLSASAMAKVDSVFFGTYDLLNDSVMGEVPVEWYVIEASDDSYMLLSRYAVAERRIDSTPETSWKSTELSRWLNNEFFNDTFSDQEKEMIVKQYDGYVSLLKENDNRSVNPIIKNNPEIMLLEQTADFRQKKWWLKLYPDLWLGLGDDKTRIRPAYDAKLFGDLYGGGMGYYEAATYYAIEEDHQQANGYSVLEYGYPLNEPLAVRPVIVVERDYVLPQLGISKPNTQSSDAVIVDELIEAMMAPGENIFDTLEPVLGEISSIPYTYSKNVKLNELHDLIIFQFTEDFSWGNHLVDSFAISVTSSSKNCEELICQVHFSIIDTSSKENGVTTEMFGNVRMYYEDNFDWRHNSGYGTTYEHKQTSALMSFEQETVKAAGEEKRRLFFELSFCMPEVDFDMFFAGRPITTEQKPPIMEEDEQDATAEKSSITKLAENFLKKREAAEAAERDSAESAMALPIEDKTETNANWKYEVRDGSVVITGFDGSIEEDIVIPDHIDGYPVVGLGNGLFSQCDNLRSVFVPEGVVFIENSVFYECVALETVTLPVGLMHIGEAVFYGCEELRELDIPDSVTSIGEAAFAYSGIREIKLSSSLKVIERDCFESSGLQSIVIPDGVETIKEWAFCQCWNLERVSIPDSVTTIRYQAFTYCENLKSINLPPYINEIAPATFYYTDIKEIVIPDGVKAIRGSAFEASALKQITIPASVTEFKEDAFPKGLETIIGEKGSAAQELAESLGVTFKETTPVSAYEAESIKHEQLESRRSMLKSAVQNQDIGVPLLKMDDSSGHIGFGYRGNGDDTGWVSGIGLDILTDIEIPDSMNGNRIIGIDDSGLEACDLIRNVIVPEGITTFGYNAFRECSRLEHVSMPESLLAIHAGAFEHCVNLKEAIIPDSVSIIGEAAFNGCISLKTARLPKNLKTIESELFQLCENLERIDIPSGVVSIKEWAFYHCEKLRILNLPDGLIEIGDYAFSRCGSLEELMLPKSVESIGLYAFKNSGIKRIVVEDGMIVLDAAAILNTEGIDELRIPESVTQIKGNGSYSQGNIKRIVGVRGTAAHNLAEDLGIEFVEMEEAVQDLSKKKAALVFEMPDGFALVDKSLLKYETEEQLGMPETRFSRIVGSKDKLIGNVAFPQNEGAVIVKEIGSWSFYNTKGITGVAIPEGVERIGSHAFYKCTGIEKIVLPSSLKYIDDYAFCDCKNLTSITIPQSVEYIGTWAFGHCYKLETVLGEPGTVAEELAKELRIEFRTIE